MQVGTEKSPQLVPVLPVLSPEIPVIAMASRIDGSKGISPVGMHFFVELGVVVSGHMSRWHGGKWFRVEAGQAWSTSPLQPHRSRFEDDGAEFIQFFFMPSLIGTLPEIDGFYPAAPFYRGPQSGAIGKAAPFRESLICLGNSLLQEKNRLMSPSTAYIALLRVLELLSQELPATDLASEKSDNPFTAARIMPALKLVEFYPQRLVTLSEAARACRMPPRTFARHFKNIIGTGFAQYALRSRLALAAHALRSSDELIKTVGYNFGFKYRSHFHQSFADHYGVSPGKYRSTFSTASICDPVQK
jgi:AraC-like DNA-binding protein